MNKYIIKKDEHLVDINLLLDHLNGVVPRGIVHIGAHKGEEVDSYLERGFQNILLIEANPDLCSDLRAKFKNDKRVKVASYAVTSENAPIEFYLHQSQSGSIESSSIMKMKDLKEIVKTLTTPKSIQVEGIKLQDLFSQKDYDISLYNVLTIDIQGAELNALIGAENILSGFQAIITEVNLIEMYESGKTEDRINALLEKHGFENKFSIYHELYNDEGRFPAWGETIFIQR